MLETEGLIGTCHIISRTAPVRIEPDAKGWGLAVFELRTTVLLGRGDREKQ